MDLSGIISIAGKPGLYSVVAQSPNSIIVENIENGRRMPAFASNKISALEDITMYTKNDDMPLPEIVQNIYDKESGKTAPDHREDIKVLRSYLDDVIPECDHERIYDSDVKKLFQWYNMMQASGTLEKKIAEAKEKEKEEKATKAEAKSDKKTEDKSKDVQAKKPAKKAAPKKTTGKAQPKKSGGKPQTKGKSTTARTSSKAK